MNSEVNNNIEKQNNNYAMNNQPTPITVDKKENVLMGTVGALIGSLAGVIVTILISQLGFIASISGVVMSLCTFYMYEKLGHGISKKGVFICILIIIGMTFVAHNLSYSLEIYKYLSKNGFKPSLFKIFFNFYEAYDLFYEDYSYYIRDILMLYGFSILGAFGIIRNKITELKK